MMRTSASHVVRLFVAAETFASILVFTDFVGAAGAAMTTLEIKLSLFKIACLTLRTLSNGVPIL